MSQSLNRLEATELYIYSEWMGYAMCTPYHNIASIQKKRVNIKRRFWFVNSNAFILRFKIKTKAPLYRL